MVISLGGSLIVPGKVNVDLLEKFKKILLRHKRKYNFVVVCGGGSVARTYMKGLEPADRKKQIFQSLLGVSITRLNARFMSYFFGKDANQGIPHSMKEVRGLLRKNHIVFCGALKYKKKQTSDGTSAQIARYFKSEFINLTNVPGLYDKNPKKSRSAKFIPEISHKDFLKMANQLDFKPGQHFVLDQKAAKIIKKYKIKTYILGPELKNLDYLLNRKHFVGTIIS